VKSTTNDDGVLTRKRPEVPGPPPTRLAYAADLERCWQEARSLADATGQTLQTTHLLLSFFTSSNPAELALGEADLDDERLLVLVTPSLGEPARTMTDVLALADETAVRCDARHVHTLHVLFAMLKTRNCAAYQLLESSLGSVAPLRNRVMSYVTGVLPRRLQQSLRDAEPPKVAVAPRAHKQAGSDDVLVSRQTSIDALLHPPPEPKANKPAPSPTPPPSAKHAPPGDDVAPRTRRKEPAPMSVAVTLPPTAFDLDPDRYPWLTQLGRNLTSLAANHAMDPAIGRTRELEQLIDVLGKRRANNPCLVGEPGVGKTAIVEGLAEKLARHDADVASLHGKVIIELDMGRITAGTSLRGSFSERMLGLKRDVQRARGQVIVFIDEIHTLMGAGGSGEGPQDAANELKTALARGDFPCIGSTTLDEFRKHIAEDQALERRFVKIVVEEPTDEESIRILQGAKKLYEKHHHVLAHDDAVSAAVQLSSRFLHDKKLPAKALDLLDLAMSRARRAGQPSIQREHVARVCADVAKVPLERVMLQDQQRFLQMEEALHQRVVGHEPVIARVAHTLRRNYAGFSHARPLGSFLFLGPSGVGKTELAKGLCEFLHADEHALIRLDMSEYSEPHTVARLTGAPPGYVGHHDGGQLTEAIRRRPHAVVLFDEIEKAHSDVLPIMLQLLDEGRLTDSRGRTVTFRHAVIIMTSNLGVAAFQHKKAVGFAAPAAQATGTPQEAKEHKRVHDGVIDLARKHFAPELWGRVDEKLVFFPLARTELMRIAGLQLQASSRALELSRSVGLHFDESVTEFLVDQTPVDGAVGARPLRQTVQRLVETPVAEALLRGEVREGSRLRLTVKDGQLVARAQRPSALR
jgi:ATP-dependent Clp protease ATP-binding subunit ClpC